MFQSECVKKILRTTEESWFKINVDNNIPHENVRKSRKRILGTNNRSKNQVPERRRVKNI